MSLSEKVSPLIAANVVCVYLVPAHQARLPKNSLSNSECSFRHMMLQAYFFDSNPAL